MRAGMVCAEKLCGQERSAQGAVRRKGYGLKMEIRECLNELFVQLFRDILII